MNADIGKATIAANNILGLRDQVRQNPPSQDFSKSQDREGEKSIDDAVVDFRNVSFSYPARPEATVLKDISLQIFPRQTVAVVGSSGSGKSTLLALLERFYDIQSGELDVFGKPIEMHEVDEYRKRLAIVPQEPNLYRGK